MSDLPSIPDLVNNEDKRPLPLIVAEKWGFPLAFAETEDGTMYAVQDWIRGLTGTKDVRTIWAETKRRSNSPELFTSIEQLPYAATNGKTYQMDFANDKLLYLIAQHLRVTKARPVLDEIKKFLAEAGAFVDLVRREPETVITSGAIDPEDAIDIAIQAYRAQGKDDRWIHARLEGKVKREKFTAALQLAVAEVLTRYHYASATDEIYKGLWGRTAAMLKNELELLPKQSLRDHQPALALTYQGLAEDVCATKLGQRTELSYVEAEEIVRVVAELIGKQAQDTSRFLNTDLATGKPLLARG